PPRGGLPPVVEDGSDGVATATPGERGRRIVTTLHVGDGGVASSEKRRHRRLPSIGQIGGRRSAAGSGTTLLRFPTQQRRSELPDRTYVRSRCSSRGCPPTA